MPEQISTTSRRHRDQDIPEVSGTDQRNPQLSEDVACCLDDIATALTAEKPERDRAIEEFREIQAQAGQDTMGSGPDAATQMRTQRWQAQYAHLGLQVGAGCCAYHLIDPATGRVIAA